MSGLRMEWETKRERLRRKDLAFIDETHAPEEGIFADLERHEAPVLSDADMEALDKMLDSHGTRKVLRAVKQLLLSRVDLDAQRLDSIYGRAAEAVSRCAANSDVGQA